MTKNKFTRTWLSRDKSDHAFVAITHESLDIFDSWYAISLEISTGRDTVCLSFDASFAKSRHTLAQLRKSLDGIEACIDAQEQAEKAEATE